MPDTADVVIVGGGGVGSSIAYWLSKLEPGRRIVVYERDPTYARASTALAAGGIRQMFSTPENILMSQFGLSFIEGAADTLAVDGERPELGLKRESYMRLAKESARDALMAQVELQRSCGAMPSVLEQAELASRFPWLNTDDVAFAVLGGGGEGVFDPYGLLQALRRKAISQGVEFRTGEVVAMDRAADGSVTGVRAADGARLACGTVVNAAGPRAASVAALAGLDLPVRPMKAHTFAFRSQTPIPDCPIVLDHVSGFNFKPEGALFLAAWPREAEPRDADDFEPDDGIFEDQVWPALAHRVPAFEAVKLARAWVGHIEWNTFDANPVLGRHPDCANYVFAAGFSGHGAQHIPAAGRGLAELLAYGEYRSLDLSRFGYGRLVENRPLRELV
jgi:FAD-dependent oxidoreductase domain-containing protein 1